MEPRKAVRMAIGRKVWNWVFGCRHKELSRAFTTEGQTYKVCLKCGAQFPYSWETMSVVEEKRGRKGKLAKGAAR